MYRKVFIFFTSPYIIYNILSWWRTNKVVQFMVIWQEYKIREKSHKYSIVYSLQTTDIAENVHILSRVTPT